MFKKITILSFLIFSVSYIFSQNTLCLGDDGAFCVGSTVTIENCGTSSQDPGQGLSIVLDNPSQVNLSDDSFSGLINIGFNFSFYGIEYDKCVIGSNGMISFNQGSANGYNSWSLDGTPLPSMGAPNDARNAAMLCYHDINPSQGGNILYQTMGEAPNRYFVVLYSNIPMFSSGDCCDMAAVFYETSNKIEYYISFKPIASWNGSRAIQGVQNAFGTVAHVTPGRNNTVWPANDDARLFEPVSPTNTSEYIISEIPFIPVFSNSASLQWKNTNGQTFPYNGGELVINSVSSGETGYFLTVSGSSCSSQVGAVSDTTWITGLTSSVTTSAVDDMCSAGIGSVTATPTSGEPPYTFNWPALGSTDQTVNNVSAGTYTVQMTDANGCTSSNVVVVGDTPADYSSETTPVSCSGGSNGTATVAMVPEIGNVTYQWNDPAQQTTATAVGLSAGTYECVITSDAGCVNTVTVEVTELSGLQVDIVNLVDVSCNSGSDGQATAVVSQGALPYSYAWSNSSSISETANDLSFGVNSVTVTDADGCAVTEEFNIGQPAPLEVVDISDDIIICIDESIELWAQGAGGSSPYIYEWYVNDVLVANGEVVTVTPTGLITEYCVVLKEECGSPSATRCVTVEWPPEVNVMIGPDITGDCYPVDVNFTNTTQTTETIDYTVWKYSDGTVDTIQGSSPTSHTFGEGVWDVEMTIVTERGCVYVQDFPSLIEGYSNPNVNFYANPNPASVLDPVVDLYSQSDPNITSYNWFVEGGTPMYSTGQNTSVRFPENVVDDYSVVLTVVNEYGCSDSLTKYISVQNEVIIYAPNTFTPDNDEYNETWGVHILGIDVHNFHLEIYNRWGELVFESFNPEGQWDGGYGYGNQKAIEGTYVWIIRVSDHQNDNKYEFKGQINLIR